MANYDGMAPLAASMFEDGGGGVASLAGCENAR